MTAIQLELIQQHKHAVEGAVSRRIVYQTEYLGYLPLGQYHWMTVADQEISLKCPGGWSWDDFEALAYAGALIRVSKWITPQDNCEQMSQYDVVLDGDTAL